MNASKEQIQRLKAKGENLTKREKEILEKDKDARKTRTLAILVTAAFLLLAVVVILLNTSLLYGATAMKCGDVKYSTADYNYFYGNTYNNYYSTYQSYYGDYAEYFMPDDDTMQETVIEAMEDAAMLYSEAKKAGYTLSEEGQSTVDNAASSMEMYAQLYGYTTKQYLSQLYGTGVTLKVFQRNVELSTLAQEYQESLRTGFTYTEDEWKEYYAENADSLDVLSYNAYYVSGAAVADDETTEEDETVDEETAMAEALETAEEFVARLEKGESFTELCAEYSGDADTYADETAALKTVSGSNLESAYSEWLLDPDRAENDAEYAETTSGYYVVQFLSRSDNDYTTVNARHILVSFADLSEDDYDDTDAYTAAVEEDEAACKEEAESLLAQWEEGDATEESFAELADANSDDSAEGGLYENIYYNQMQQEFEDWCFDSSRQPGDTGVIRTAYGYHVMYFVGAGLQHCDALADDGLREADYGAWETERADTFAANCNVLFNLFCK